MIRVRWLAALLCLASVQTQPASAEELLIGVMGSHQFRWSDAPAGGAPRWWPRRAPPKPRLAPLSFDEQLSARGWRVVHLPVLADPQPGRWARGDLAGVQALRQVGLKVVTPEAPDPDAVCFTFMTCLMQLEAWSRARPGHEPVIVIAHATRPPPRTGRFARVRRLFGDEEVAAPSWAQMAREVETAVPAFRRAMNLDDANGRLVVIAVGASGDAPAAAPFLIGAPNGDIAMFDAPQTPVWVMQKAIADGARAGVLNLDWRDDDHGDMVGARAARALGAELFVFAPEAVRRPPVLVTEVAAR